MTYSINGGEKHSTVFFTCHKNQTLVEIYVRTIELKSNESSSVSVYTSCHTWKGDKVNNITGSGHIQVTRCSDISNKEIQHGKH